MTDGEPDDLAEETRRLREQIEVLNQKGLGRQRVPVWRIGVFQFYRGLAFGLGSVVGATLLISVVIRMLSSIDFIPIIGEWAQQLILWIQAAEK